MVVEIHGVDLADASTIPDIINVVNYGRASVQFIPESEPSGSAVITAEISRDPDGHYRDAFDSPPTVDVDGSAFTEIDVTDIGFLAFSVTTADAGTGRIVVSLTERITGWFDAFEIDVHGEGFIEEYEGNGEYMFFHAVPLLNSTASAVIEVQRFIDPKYPVSDSPANEIPVNTGDVGVRRTPDQGLALTVTTAQSGQRYRVFVYSRMGAPVATSPAPDEGDYLRRMGNAWDNTKLILAEDGSSSNPGIGFYSDPNNGLYRSGVDEWRAVVGGYEVIYLGTAGGGLFSTLTFDASIVVINGSISWNVSAPDVVITNDDSALGALVSFREGATNGVNEIEILAPAALTKSFDIELWDAQPAYGTGVFFSSIGKLASSKWVNAVPIVFEENGTISTGTSGGFQWSIGNGQNGDGYGAVIPYDYEIVAISVAVKTAGAGTSCTVEAYVGADEATSSSATGVDVSLGSGEYHAYSDVSGSPVAGNAGDYIHPKTTANSGAIAHGRVAIWIRPTE